MCDSGTGVALMPVVLRRTAFLRCSLPLAVLVAACGVSPQPSPPISDPPELDGGLVSIGVSPEGVTDSVSIYGGPGTVDPPEGVVVITNLETDDAPSIAPVQPDGSFEILLNGATSDILRLQVDADAGRSEPVDLRITGVDTGVEPAPIDFDCLVLEPALWLPLDGEGDVRSIVLENGCADAITIAAPRLRRGQAGFTFSPTAPLDLAAGASVTITVRAAAAQAEDEDVLFFEIVSPTAGRRAVTVTR
jgi:hypothetical protein